MLIKWYHKTITTRQSEPHIIDIKVNERQKSIWVGIDRESSFTRMEGLRNFRVTKWNEIIPLLTKGKTN